MFTAFLVDLKKPNDQYFQGTVHTAQTFPWHDMMACMCLTHYLPLCGEPQVTHLWGDATGCTRKKDTDHWRFSRKKRSFDFMLSLKSCFKQTAVNWVVTQSRDATVTLWFVYGDVTMGTITSQITSLMIVYSTVYSGADQSKHQSSASLAFVWEIHRGPVNFPHKWPVTRKMFPFDDVIMLLSVYRDYFTNIYADVVTCKKIWFDQTNRSYSKQ